MSEPRKEVLSDGIEIWLGDCRDVLEHMPSDSIEMIWTDPPYGHGNHDGDFNARLNEHRKIEDRPIANDDHNSMRLVVDAMLTQAARVLRKDCCCCCCCCGGGGPRPTFAWVADRMDSFGLSFFHSVIWDKRNPGLGWRYRRRHEMVMIAHRKGGALLWHNDAIASPNIVDVFPPINRFHPNEKPLELVSHFLRLHSSPGHIVLDPFMGSGTTGVACVNLGRSFIGIEKEERYFDIACRRISEALSSPRLPFDAPVKPKQESLL